MLFSYEWLQSFFEKKLPEPKVLEDLIIRHSFEVESVKKSGKDFIFDIAILSNRPDCFSHIGIAREIGAVLGIKPVFPKAKKAKAKGAVMAKSLLDVKLEDSVACRRYTAMMVSGIKVGPSPKWVQERLEACGMRAINNVVDATNYVMLETGQPLHAFDFDKLQNVSSKSKLKKIIVRRASEGENIEVLGDKKFKLTADALLIADEGGSLALAGIKGGKRAEISEKTTTIVIESANFDPRVIRRTSRGIGLQTDASLRYEHCLDPNETENAALRVAEIVGKSGGGQVFAGMIDRYPSPVKPKRFILDMENVESLLGVQIQSARIKKILEALGFSVRKGKGLSMEIVSPTRRVDVTMPVDLVEEIGRIGGYENVMAQLPVVSILPPGKNYAWQWKNRAKDALAAAGYSEVRNYTFVCENDNRVFGFAGSNILEVRNPVNLDLRFMRPSLLINLLKNVKKNASQAQLRQFEIGKIFGANLRMEPTMLAGFDAHGTFFEMKGALEFACRNMGIGDFKAIPLGAGVDSLFDADQSARFFANGKEIGIGGKISSEITEKLGIEPVFAFELSMDVLVVIATEKIKYEPLSIYPQAIRDLSVDVPVRIAAASVAEAATRADNLKLIKDVEIPESPYISGGKKNILFKFHLHSDKKTLDSNEISVWQEKTIAAIEKNPEWHVKK
ncbi:MAG: phenylalanine--tRNA ligase subunit beta [Candidatus Paceibacterota bacterium]